MPLFTRASSSHSATGADVPSHEDARASPPPRSFSSLVRTKLASATRKTGKAIAHHSKFIGPGIVASVAYFDPGNWSVDLQAGSAYGYRLLFVVLMAGLGAILLQVQATRLGIVTGLDLARHTRLLLHDRPRHKMFYRWGLLYPIYVLVEIAIIATDLAELLGSAIALNLLFPVLPLYAGVLLTSLDVLIILAFFQRDSADNSRKGTRTFEIIIVGLVLAVFGCFAVLVVRIEPLWNKVFEGYLPSKTVFGPGALYVSIGIIGATVMPHALFIGSRLATVDRLDLLPRDAVPEQTSKFWRLPSRNIMGLFPDSWRRMGAEMGLKVRGQSDRKGKGRAQMRSPTPEEDGRDLKSPAEQEDVDKIAMETLRADTSDGLPRVDAEEDEEPAPATAFNRVHFIKQHITHATVDIVCSLLGFAVTINSSILVIAATAFFYRSPNPGAATADLFDAYELIKDFIGNGPALLFAIALLCSGQSASITATLAGQVVSEGFIEWKTSPFLRRVLTRLISMVPAIVVAVAVGRDGIDTLLVASQVVLSIVLPFVIFPLVFICSSNIMVVDAPEESIEPTPAPSHVEAGTPEVERAVELVAEVGAAEEGETAKKEGVSFKSPLWVTCLGYFIFVLVVVANSYVIVTLAIGHE